MDDRERLQFYHKAIDHARKNLDAVLYCGLWGVEMLIHEFNRRGSIHGFGETQFGSMVNGWFDVDVPKNSIQLASWALTEVKRMQTNTEENRDAIYDSEAMKAIRIRAEKAWAELRRCQLEADQLLGIEREDDSNNSEEQDPSA